MLLPVAACHTVARSGTKPYARRTLVRAALGTTGLS